MGEWERCEWEHYSYYVAFTALIATIYSMYMKHSLTVPLVTATGIYSNVLSNTNKKS